SIMLRDPPPLRNAPRDLATIVGRALEKEQARRFDSALAMAEELERFVRGEPIRTRPVSVGERLRKLARRHPLPSTILLVASLVVLALGGLLWSRDIDLRRDHDHLVAAVQGALAADRPDSAVPLLHELESRHGVDATSGDLASRIRSAQQRDALLDELLADPRDQDLQHLERLASALGAAHPTVLAEPTTGAARALLAAYAGDRDAAAQALADPAVSQSFPRFVAAIHAHLAGSDPLAILAPLTAATSADDHVLTATVLRLAEAEANAVSAELGRALARDRSHDRARFGIAVDHLNRGRPDRAEDVLSDRESSTQPRSLIVLAYCALRRGDPETARSRLAAARARLAELGRPPLLRLERTAMFAALAAGDLAQFDQLLARASAQWGESAQLQLLEAEAAVLQGDSDAARRAFRRAMAIARHPSVHREAAIAILQLDNAALQGGEVPPDRAPLVAAELFERAEALRTEALDAGDARIGSDAFVVQHDLLAAQGRSAEARVALDAALDADPENPDAVHLFVTNVYERVAALAGDSTAAADAFALGDAARAARDCCERVLARSANDVTYVAPQQLCEMLLAGVGLAAFAGDRQTAERWLDAAAEIAEDHDLDELQAQLTGFAALVR
ncbi:MAG: hypothetical protein KDE27_05035, partial [Planctomycetes bacterium]|nr:hypothetical protein [Planctomycetota bacterium]